MYMYILAMEKVVKKPVTTFVSTEAIRQMDLLAQAAGCSRYAWIAAAIESRITKEPQMAVKSAISSRRTTAVESFKTAAECIGEITPGKAIFAVTRGQFSMIDAILACLDQAGPSNITVWTWTVAEYEIEVFERLMRDSRVKHGTLIIDHGARNKNAGLIKQWKSIYGEDSVRYVLNHSKICTIESDRFRLLLRGSMNLNFNPRFEQFDLTEGGGDFDLVREIESELPILRDSCSGAEAYKATRVSEAFDKDQLDIFKGVRVWAK